VNDQQGAGAGSDGAFYGCRIEVESDGVDLRKDRRGADLEDGVGHCDEGEGRDDYLVACSDAEGEQGDVKAGGARA